MKDRYPGPYPFWNFINIFIFALTIEAYGAIDWHLDESSDSYVMVDDFSSRTITFDFITLWVQSRYIYNNVRIKTSAMHSYLDKSSDSSVTVNAFQQGQSHLFS